MISPGAHQLTLGFILDKTSVGNIAANDGPFVTYTVMPKGVSFDYDASMTNGVIPFGNQYSVIDNFNGTGQQVLKIVWPDKSIMVPGESSGTRVIVNIDDGHLRIWSSTTLLIWELKKKTTPCQRRMCFSRLF